VDSTYLDDATVPMPGTVEVVPPLVPRSADESAAVPPAFRTRSASNSLSRSAPPSLSTSVGYPPRSNVLRIARASTMPCS